MTDLTKAWIELLWLPVTALLLFLGAMCGLWVLRHQRRMIARETPPRDGAMTAHHWTLDALHLGALTDAEAHELEREIEAVCEQLNIRPGQRGEYSILGAFRAEYEQAREYLTRPAGTPR